MYADVILPLPLPDIFTYAVPAGMENQIETGFRVVVPFGRRKYYTAIVKALHGNAPAHINVKEIHSLIDSHAVVNEQQLRLWEWISFYYMVPLGDVYKAALPTSMKPEDLRSSFTPKTGIFIQINPSLGESTVVELVGRAKKQQQLMDEISSYLATQHKEILSKKEMSGFTSYSPAVFNGLLQKEILLTHALETGRIPSGLRPTRDPYPLNEHQQKAFTELRHSFTEKQTTLLHGVASSGKTEIFIHLILQMMAEGRQTLYLLPEIALTTQLTQRLQAVFGDQIGIYHSRINDNERTEIWQKMVSDNPYSVMLGVRSSIFLPFQQLGLVIVDEEHATSYKQQEPAPRYHARDAAIMLALFHKAKTVLGSATPSIESFHHALTGKYGLVTLTERFNGMMMPRIQIENTRDLRKRKRMKTLLAPALIAEMEGALAEGEQVILFRNRRGYASLIECSNCAWTPRCSRCDVTLTYHKKENQLVCHYCNSHYRLPTACPSCHEESLKPLGLGTEQLEEEVAQLFPGSVVARMDMDSTRGKDAYEKIITDFQERKIQILVGTQMLSKGLDFDNVRVVGIITADSLLNYPDFRSHERGYQLMTQAAGRSGRKNRQGVVIIQSADPGLDVYTYVTHHNYEAFFHRQLAERKLFNYPPFCRLIRIVLKHKEEKKAVAAADFMAASLKKTMQERLLGPNKPIVSRIQLYHIREILLKLENGLSPQKVREILRKAEDEVRNNPEWKYVSLYYDIDPL